MLPLLLLLTSLSSAAPASTKLLPCPPLTTPFSVAWGPIAWRGPLQLCMCPAGTFCAGPFCEAPPGPNLANVTGFAVTSTTSACRPLCARPFDCEDVGWC